MQDAKSMEHRPQSQRTDDRGQNGIAGCGQPIATHFLRGEQVLMGSNNKSCQIFRKNSFTDKFCMVIAYSKGSSPAHRLALLLSSKIKGHQFSSAMSFETFQHQTILYFVMSGLAGPKNVRSPFSRRERRRLAYVQITPFMKLKGIVPLCGHAPINLAAAVIGPRTPSKIL